MIRKAILIYLVPALLMLCAGNTLQAKKQTFDQLCVEIVETMQSFYAVQSTQMGIHSYDHRLTDYSNNAVKSMVSKAKDYHKKLRRFRGATLSPHQAVNYKLIESNLNTLLLHLDKIRWHQVSPQLFVDDMVNGVYSLLVSKHAPLSERVYPILSRMKDVPKVCATARSQIKKAPPVYIEVARQSLADGSDFFQQVAGELMGQFPERADEILRVTTAAREAMNDLDVYLADLPRSEDNSFAIGKLNFDYLLSHTYFLEYDSDSLLAIGERLLLDAQAEYGEYEAEVEANYQNGQDSVFIPATFARQDILDYYAWETNQVKAFLDMVDFVTVPDGIADIDIVETPAFLRSMISGIAYMPAGPFDSTQNGIFYVRPLPEQMDRRQLDARYRYVHRRGFRGAVVHEAYPGHHLQTQLVGMLDDPVRKWQQNALLTEGWALYCEEAMYHAGLYGDVDPAQWLKILGGIRFRAARIVADVKLHTGRFSLEECVEWMCQELEAESESEQNFIRSEVRRYTLMPGYQMSYLIGKLQIEQLREKMADKLGDNYSDRTFHDALLGEGSIPPALIGEALEL